MVTTENSPDGLGPTGFDPSRLRAAASALAMAEGFSSPEATVLIGLKPVPVWRSRIPRVLTVVDHLVAQPWGDPLKGLPETLRRTADAMDNDGGYPRSAVLMREAALEIIALRRKLRARDSDESGAQRRMTALNGEEA